MKPFLLSVAEAYCSLDSGINDLSRLCFVFPNKRSGTFFLKYISTLAPDGSILPRITTISDFVADISGVEVDSRIDLLFLLFESYRELLVKTQSVNEDVKTGINFDGFRRWGETVLNDFNDVDMQLVDPGMIFRNVKDLKEINSNFLTEEQRRVMETYFGYRGTEYEPGKFWRSFPEVSSDGAVKEDSKGIKRKFLYLWQILGPLYRIFNEKLKKLGLSTQGGCYRLAAEILKNEDACLPNLYERIIFIGFNALSRSELSIFKSLRKLRSSTDKSGYARFAEFFWDASGPFFQKGDEAWNPASRFIEHNKELFPSPRWAEKIICKSDISSLPKMEIVSVPSNSAQIKLIGEDVAELFDLIGTSKFRDAKVAVVLPDEKLLQPLLFSLPEKVGNPNLTMGYPLRQTSVTSFVSLLRRLLLRQRGSVSSPSFFFQDLKPFLSHPYSQAVFGSRRISGFIVDMERLHKSFISIADIENLGKRAVDFIRPLHRKASPSQIVDYLDNILSLVENVMKERGSRLLKGNLECGYIGKYRDALRILRSSFVKYKVEMSRTTTFILIDRMISAEMVSFEGEPLQGLQVMGMLETRCLDFDYVFIPSLNEKILPRKARQHTFIPNALRREYGMPPANYQEEIFAYYFFRLLSRSKEVKMFYDSRGGERGSGISRYLLQMKYSLPDKSIKETDTSFLISSKTPESRTISKKGKIGQLLSLFLQPESGRNLSASALISYTECPTRFCYKEILRINTDPEPGEAIDAITTGHIIHGVMMDLYLPDEKERGVFLTRPKRIESELISSIIRNQEIIEMAVRRRINLHHFRLTADKLDTPLTGSPAIVAPKFCTIIRNILNRDLSQTPFDLYGCEVTGTSIVNLPDGRNVNFRFAIDRIDRPADDSSAPLRIVDYKTGRVSLEADTLEAVFEGDYKGKNILQLMLYAGFLQKYIQDFHPHLKPIVDLGIKMEIYDVPKINSLKERVPVIGSEAIPNSNSYCEEFKKLLTNTLEEIFNMDEDFTQTTDLKRCEFCPLADICNR